MPHLKIIRGPIPGTFIDLVDDTITIGRGRRNDVVIQDNEVSREHCRLVRVLNDYEIHDLQSTNGTFVNGQRVDSGGWLLTPNAVIELGDSITLEYLSSDMPSSMIIPVMKLDTAALEEWHLVIRRSDEPDPITLDLIQSVIAIGRDTDNDYIIPEPEISRHHLRLLRTQDGYVAEDLNTLNGTTLNGRRLDRQILLRDGDYLKLGKKTELWYTTTPDEIELTPRSDAIDDSWPDKRIHLGDTEMLTARNDAPRRATVEVSEVGHGLVPEQLEGHVFVAYQRSLWREVVGPLLLTLQDRGIPAWVDQYLLPESEDWRVAIEQAQSECAVLIVVVDNGVMEVPYIQRAVRHFAAREKPIILLNYGDMTYADLPLTLSEAPRIQYQSAARDTSFAELITTILTFKQRSTDEVEIAEESSDTPDKRVTLETKAIQQDLTPDFLKQENLMQDMRSELLRLSDDEDDATSGVDVTDDSAKAAPVDVSTTGEIDLEAIMNARMAQGEDATPKPAASDDTQPEAVDNERELLNALDTVDEDATPNPDDDTDDDETISPDD